MKKLISLFVFGVLLCAQGINVSVLEKDESDQIRHAYLEMKAAEGKFSELKRALAKKYGLEFYGDVDFGSSFKTIQHTTSATLDIGSTLSCKFNNCLPIMQH